MRRGVRGARAGLVLMLQEAQQPVEFRARALVHEDHIEQLEELVVARSHVLSQQRGDGLVAACRRLEAPGHEDTRICC